MTTSILMTLIMSFFMSVSPVSLGTTILFTALFTAMVISLVTSSWFSLITFIIYVGGMLVMFAYFAALQPNQHISNWSWWLIMPLMTMSIMILSPREPFNLSPQSNMVSSLYLHHNAILIIFLALLLFLALIAVVKVSRSFEGPLRPFEYV
uniref:NADH-ubiquinone oxidoreductase chain 6 n=1 Tax=Neanthes glandicincta TaxID=595970 RepID=A0A343J7G4_9ANNE|nr:NADH dehydrogenase subunit 6 [Neanthes glandicincta]ASW20414.1 NADH dehydrogenase subunit 6 [Neanthes glandicincta]